MDANTQVLRLTTDIVARFVGSNKVTGQSVPTLITSVAETLINLDSQDSPIQEVKRKPAVPIAKSIQNDFIICLEDGKKLKMLKRYLWSRYRLSPEEYRRRWGLPPEYPMVAPVYSARRSQYAKQFGLGIKTRRGRKIS